MEVNNEINNHEEYSIYKEGFLLTDKPFPVTNHTRDINQNNLGWIRGITDDGYPFEAEHWIEDETEGLDIIMPIIHEREESAPNEEDAIVPFNYEVWTPSGAVLCIGMLSDGVEEDLAIIKTYIDYLKSISMVFYTGIMENGYVEYLIDTAGNSFARISITLYENDEEIAFTPLQFIPFKTGKKMFRCV